MEDQEGMICFSNTKFDIGPRRLNISAGFWYEYSFDVRSTAIKNIKKKKKLRRRIEKGEVID